MSNAATLRHNLILQRLRNSPATIQEILDYIELRTEVDHATQKPTDRTFRRDKAAILRTYQIDIKYRTTDKRYYLDEEASALPGERIIEAFNLSHMLKLPEALSGQILLEKRRPKGTEHVDRLLQAIRQQLMVRYTYQSFTSPDITERTVYPYALKEFKGRWYLLATESKDGPIKSFGLDRMSGLETTKRAFKIPRGFNPEQKYRDCFGIMGPNSEAPSNIILSFEPVAGRYIKSFPLHHSQHILLDNEEEVQIQLHLYETRDFIMELLSFGSSLKVITPSTLKSTIRHENLKSLQSLTN